MSQKNTNEMNILFKIAGAPVVAVKDEKVKEEKRVKGLFYYDLRMESGIPIYVEKEVTVDYYGTIVTTSPIKEIEENKNDLIPDYTLTEVEVTAINQNMTIS